MKNFLCLFLAVILLSFCTEGMCEDDTSNYEKGDLLPPFMLKKHKSDNIYVALRDYCGEPREERKALPRKPVIISFFDVRCISCKKEIPELEKLSSEWTDQVQVFLISVGDSPEELSAWQKTLPTELTILTDRYSTLPDRYGFNAVPTIFLLDKDGKIFHKKTGYSPGDEQILKQKVNQLIN